MTKEALNELGGTFDTPDDVIQRLIKEAGYELPSETDEQQTGTTDREQSRIKKALVNRLPQSDWLNTRKQRDVVIGVTERYLELPSDMATGERRRQAQKYVLDNSDVENIQTIQDQCGRRLFDGYTNVPGNRWTDEFDRVLEDVEARLTDEE